MVQVHRVRGQGVRSGRVRRHLQTEHSGVLHPRTSWHQVRQQTMGSSGGQYAWASLKLLCGCPWRPSHGDGWLQVIRMEIVGFNTNFNMPWVSGRRQEMVKTSTAPPPTGSWTSSYLGKQLKQFFLPVGPELQSCWLQSLPSPVCKCRGEQFSEKTWTLDICKWLWGCWTCAPILISIIWDEIWP